MKLSMPQLQLPSAALQIRPSEKGKSEVLCLARKKWVILEPEEWVRQHVLNHLHVGLGYPLGCMSVEHQLTLNGMSRRADIVAYTPDGKPRILVECKAYNVTINQDAVTQAARYNLVLKVPVLLVTNGLQHAAFELDDQGQASPLSQLPVCPSH